MNSKQIIGAIGFVGGIALLFFAHYINVQVEAGNSQIFSAQKQVDQSNSLFSMSRYSKSMGQGMTSGAQNKINAGKETVAYYTVVAERCQLGGIALMVVGAGMMYFCRTKKKGRKS